MEVEVDGVCTLDISSGAANDVVGSRLLVMTRLPFTNLKMFMSLACRRLHVFIDRTFYYAIFAVSPSSVALATWSASAAYSATMVDCR